MTSSPEAETPIWRYISLAKYVDLLKTHALYFPKAALFHDDAEGKWWGHAWLYDSANRWRQAPANIQTIRELIERAGHDPTTLISEIEVLLPSANKWVRDMLSQAKRCYPDKRREMLEGVISGWVKNYDGHNKSVDQWKSDLEIHRHSTYISCWNRASSMSLAMYEMYGNGHEAVAIRSTVGQLEALIKENTDFLAKNRLEAYLAEVEYLKSLKAPDEETQHEIYRILFERDRDYRIGLFAIKPDIFHFEQEVRAVILEKREMTDPLEEFHPLSDAFALRIGTDNGPTGSTMATFIDGVYLHPTIGEDSMMFQVVKEINNRFGVEHIPVVAEKIEALGPDVRLPART